VPIAKIRFSNADTTEQDAIEFEIGRDGVPPRSKRWSGFP
jgi:hypothetical protein